MLMLPLCLALISRPRPRPRPLQRVTRDMLKTSASPANNLAGYYSTCSYGKTIFNPDNFIVVGPVPMKCAGNIPAIPRPPRPAPPPRPPPRTISTKPAPPPLSRRNATYEDWWDLSRFCSASEQQAWERAAEAFAQAVSEAECCSQDFGTAFDEQG
mgnify:CR=1 FL=1